MTPAETQRNGLQKAEMERAPAVYGRTGQVSRPGERGPSTDRVSLTNLGRHLQAALGSTADRLARVEELALDVESGRYRVDDQQLATRLVDDMLLPGFES
jgi:anti-sigma28 factor (negative regulator of flagellin synthesis)